MIALVAAACVIAVRNTGLLERLELLAYDRCLRELPKPAGYLSPVVLVTITEDDIQSFGHPLQDGKLAELLEKLAAAEPIAIGLDLYRDLPVYGPDGDAGFQRLSRVFESDERIVPIYRYGSESDGTRETPPPPALRGTSRSGFNNVVVDLDNITRRALYLNELTDGVASPSFAFLLAMKYMQWHNIRFEFEGQNLSVGDVTISPIPTAAGYQFLLDYRSVPKFPATPVSRILDTPPAPGSLRGKIVLIGTDAPSVRDDDFAPNRPAGRFGLEHHADVVDQFVRAGTLGHLPPVFAPTWMGLSLIVIAALGGAAASFTVLWRWGAWVLLLLVLVASILFVTWQTFLQGTYLPVVPALLSLGIAMGLNTTRLTRREHRERESVTKLFGQAVDPAVVTWLLERRRALLQDGKLAPSRCVATVLFADIVGFSNEAENQPPEEVIVWLNDLLAPLTSSIRDHGGVINKYIGDAIMALFGVPVSSDASADHRQSAVASVSAALAMRDVLVRVNADRAARQKAPLQLRIGIHSGPLVHGTLGDGHRQEYTVIGNTVNTASRLESFDRERMEPAIAPSGCRVLISSDTLELLVDQFTVTPLGPTKLKGVGIKELFAVTDHQGSLRRQAEPRVAEALGG